MLYYYYFFLEEKGTYMLRKRYKQDGLLYFIFDVGLPFLFSLPLTLKIINYIFLFRLFCFDSL